MTINPIEGESFHVKQSRPDRRWIRFFIKQYSAFVGVVTSIIIILSLYLVDIYVLIVALIGYWVYLAIKFRNRYNPKYKKIYHSTVVQFIRTLFLISGVTLLLYHVYTSTSYQADVKVDTLWLLYLLAISVISQRGSRILFILTLAIVVISLYLVTPSEGRIIIASPIVITLEFLTKSFWLVSLAGLTYILLRYMSDAVADMNLIVNVQNHIREMEGDFLRTATDLDKSKYLEKSVEIIKDDLQYNHVNVYHLDRYSQKLICVAAACQDGKRLVKDGYTVSIDGQESIIGHVVKTGQSYVTNNTAKDPHFLRTSAFPNTMSEMVVPIKSRNRLYGVLDIQVQQSNYFLEQDRKAIEILANNIGWVVDNSEQFEHISWVNRIIEKIALPIFTQNYLDDTLQEIADVAQKELGADLVMLYSYDPKNNTKVRGPIYAGQPLHPELLLQISGENDNVVYRLLDKGKSIYYVQDMGELDLNNHSLFEPSSIHRATGRPTFIVREKIKANVIIRLLNNEQCVGILFLNFRKPRIFTYWDSQRYFSFANLAALAIQKMHSQQHMIQLEMTDLSNRIHDTLIGDTLGLHKVLSSIDQIDNSGVEDAQENIQLAISMTDHLHNDIRYISRLLKDDLSNDIPSEIDKFAFVLNQAFKISIDLYWSIDPVFLPSPLSRELLIVIREAITNAAKHARANSIIILGEVVSDDIQIQIIDNGRGFDPHNIQRINGLASMRYRMKELGGEFDLESEIGMGTIISLSMPIGKDG